MTENTGEAAVELLNYVIELLLDEPEAARVEVLGDAQQGWVVEVEVSSKDYGLILGKSGRTAMSLRALLEMLAQKRGEKIRLEIANERQPPGPRERGESQG